MTIKGIKQLIQQLIKEDAKGNAKLINLYERKIKEATTEALPKAMEKAFNQKSNIMKISTITGYLTQTEKSHIKALFDARLTEGKINRKTYRMTQQDIVYTVRISENRAGIGIGSEVKLRTSIATFKVA